jgi:hypothetical protein
MDTNQNETPNQLQQKNESIRKPLGVEPVEQLKRLWKTFQIYEGDPLQEYCFEQDYQLSETSATYDEYWRLAQQQNPKKLTSLLFESWKWKADSRNNVVMSTEGTQGSGKSLSNIEFCRILGKIFDRPFSLQDIAFYPEEMENLISNSQNRQTMMCDEQQQTNVGLMSNTIRNRLVDYEEELRWSQTNLCYVAPSLHQHQHYYVLESFKPVRLRNKVCNVCRKPNCLNCEIQEEKRSGYPAYFVLMLKTHRANDGMLVPRGYVLAKMPPLKIAKEYELIKQEHIRRLKAKESMRWDFLKKLAEEIWQGGQNRILQQTKSGKYVVASQKIIKIVFYGFKGMNYLPTMTEELLLTMIAEKAREYIITEGLNEDIEKEENKKAGEEDAV